MAPNANAETAETVTEEQIQSERKLIQELTNRLNRHSMYQSATNKHFDEVEETERRQSQQMKEIVKDLRENEQEDMKRNIEIVSLVGSNKTNRLMMIGLASVVGFICLVLMIQTALQLGALNETEETLKQYTSENKEQESDSNGNMNVKGTNTPVKVEQRTYEVEDFNMLFDDCYAITSLDFLALPNNAGVYKIVGGFVYTRDLNNLYSDTGATKDLQEVLVLYTSLCSHAIVVLRTPGEKLESLADENALYIARGAHLTKLEEQAAVYDTESGNIDIHSFDSSTAASASSRRRLQRLQTAKQKKCIKNLRAVYKGHWHNYRMDCFGGGSSNTFLHRRDG